MRVYQFQLRFEAAFPVQKKPLQQTLKVRTTRLMLQQAQPQ